MLNECLSLRPETEPPPASLVEPPLGLPDASAEGPIAVSSWRLVVDKGAMSAPDAPSVKSGASTVHVGMPNGLLTGSLMGVLPKERGVSSGQS